MVFPGQRWAVRIFPLAFPTCSRRRFANDWRPAVIRHAFYACFQSCTAFALCCGRPGHLLAGLFSALSLIAVLSCRLVVGRRSSGRVVNGMFARCLCCRSGGCRLITSSSSWFWGFCFTRNEGCNRVRDDFSNIVGLCSLDERETCSKKVECTLYVLNKFEIGWWLT